MMLEDMDQGPITNIIYSQYEVYSEDFCKYTLFKVAMGLLKLHKSDVLHRDIRSNRIQCTTDGQIKISDLGCFTIITEENNKRQTPKSSPNWTAPEVASGFPYSKASDVWSFGCFAYELATGMPPFSNIISKKRLFNKI